MLTLQIPDRRIPYCMSAERAGGTGGGGTSGLVQPLEVTGRMLDDWGSNTKKRDFFYLRGRQKSAFDAAN
jgi:hypothetical protein